MRVVLGRVALLLGVLIVAAMAWYGANALFDMGSDDGDGDPPAARSCEAATKRQAKAAERTFAKTYGRARWLSGFGVGDTDSVEDATPPIEGDGAVLLVTHLPRAKLPDLPDCIKGVPVVYVAAGPFVGD